MHTPMPGFERPTAPPPESTVDRLLALPGVRALKLVDPDLRRHIQLLPVLGLTMLSGRRGSPEALPDDGHRPVVFVYGYAGHPGQLLPMELYFRLHGRRRTYVCDFGSAHSVDLMVALFAEFLDDVYEVNGLPQASQVDIVAHSMGGLIARLALLDPQVSTRIANLVTMGTPHAGTQTARLVNNHLSQALRPGSPVIERIRSQVPWQNTHQHPHLTNLWSATDLMVMPAESGLLEGAENVEMPGYTHYSFLLAPHAWRTVFNILLRH